MFEHGSFPEGAFYIHTSFQGRKVIVYGAGESFHYFKEVVMRQYGYIPLSCWIENSALATRLKGFRPFHPWTISHLPRNRRPGWWLSASVTKATLTTFSGHYDRWGFSTSSR